MTYEELDLLVSEHLERLAYEGVTVEKLIFGPDAVDALSQYPGPMVQMKPDDPHYGERSFRGIPWVTMKKCGITFIHKNRNVPTYDAP